jgi:hypothetical protein
MNDTAPKEPVPEYDEEESDAQETPDDTPDDTPEETSDELANSDPPIIIQGGGTGDPTGDT